MRTAEFDYILPSELIAQSPAEPRDSSRLMVMNRGTGTVEHQRFSDIAGYLRPGDLLVLNNTRVVPARLHGRRDPSGGKVEALLIRRTDAGVWEALVRPGRRLKEGDKLIFSSNGPLSEAVEAQALARTAQGTRLLRFSQEAAVFSVGKAPLPPYIKKPLQDSERYQTVYSSVAGSVAAPTAGLHFTEELLEKIRASGVEIAFVTLHIGMDTFRPVREEDPMLHPMHRELYSIEEGTAQLITNARREGRRIVVVGTSTARALEQAALDQGVGAGDGGPEELRAHKGWAGLLVLPGHCFQLVDALITNFHLPRSTLLMMVSAFAGKEFVLSAYQEAIERRYRFYSFGDATLIV